MDLQLAGKVAVVTGASKGIGLAVTSTLLGEGAMVVAASRTEGPALAALRETYGDDLVHCPVDLMDADAPGRVVERAVAAYGGLDVLVNNAGGPPPGVTLPVFSFDAAPDDDWRKVFELNLFAAVRAVRAAVPHLLERGGTIVNVSTVLARQPGRENSHYAAAKAAVDSLTRSLSEEYAPQGVRVNTVLPGPVRTAWWTEPGGAADVMAAAFGADRDSVMDTLAPQAMGLTTGRLADPQEVADVVVLLASPRSASTTGAAYAVDSGYLKAG